jgi:hypothetical protein
MHTRLSPFAAIALAFTLQVFSAASAAAVTMNVAAQGVCLTSGLGVQVTVTSDAPAIFINNSLQISINAVQVGGPYTLLGGGSVTDTFAVSGSAGDTLAITAFVPAEWVDASGTVVGRAGGSASTTATLPDNCEPPTTPGVGRFTGGGNTIDTATGLKMTRGFTIHCDLVLSNNLEINWPGSGRQNQFHMLQHTAATCTDDPSIDQRPPQAPVDRIDGVGTGRFNGVDGYTLYFTLVDAGEPGRYDEIGFRIVSPTGAEVLNMPLQHITGGNVQAHYDQPHRNRR